MTSFDAFLTMGGYAGFIWPAYALAAVVMVAVLLASLRAVSSSEGELERLQSMRPARRRARTTEPAPSESTEE